MRTITRHQCRPIPGAAADAASQDLHLMVVAHVAAALVTAALLAYALHRAQRHEGQDPQKRQHTPAGGKRGRSDAPARTSTRTP